MCSMCTSCPRLPADLLDRVQESLQLVLPPLGGTDMLSRDMTIVAQEHNTSYFGYMYKE
jgi:hypothetical protein